jgi:G3E family GTPase
MGLMNEINSTDPLLYESDDDEPPMLTPLVAGSTLGNNNTEEEEPLPPCPVSILSGFLGSGKTTLIQYILKSSDHGKRIAVIENEYGEGLAVESLIARDGLSDNNNLQDLIELPNGCICCTVKDTLVSTLENLVEKRADLDYILIEASGMANPGPIASVFWLDDALDSRLQLDGIVTLVDSNKILEQLESTEEAAQQIAYADRLLINKVDLLKEDGALEKVKATLKQLHPTAPTLETSYSEIPNLDWILDSNCFGGIDRLTELDKVWQEVEEATEQDHKHDHHEHDDHHHNHSHDHLSDESCNICLPPTKHRHTAGVSTVAFQIAGSVNLSKLNKWLADILWPNQDAEDKVLTAMLHKSTATTTSHLPKDNKTVLFRIKGIMSVQGDEDCDEEEETNYDTSTGLDQRRFIVQAVHDLWEVYPASKDLQWKKNEDRICKLVLIGKHLQEQVLRQGFESCFVI